MTDMRGIADGDLAAGGDDGGTVLLIFNIKRPRKGSRAVERTIIAFKSMTIAYAFARLNDSAEEEGGGEHITVVRRVLSVGRGVY